MATQSSRTARRRAVLARLETLTGRLRERYSLPEPDPGPLVRDQELVDIIRMEALADTLDAVHAKLTPTPLRRSARPEPAA